MNGNTADHDIEHVSYQELLGIWKHLGIFEDKKYSEPWCISPSERSRVTIVLPPKFHQWRKIVIDVLRLMNQDCSMYVWRRKKIGPPDTTDSRGVLPLLLEKLKGIPENGGGYQFPWQSFDVLCELCLANLYNAQSVGNDLFIVPSNGKGVVYLDHHDAIHVYGEDATLDILRQMYPDAI